MGAVREYAIEKTELLVREFGQRCQELGLEPVDVDFGTAWAVVVSQAPEAGSVWEKEWGWVQAWLKKNMADTRA